MRLSDFKKIGFKKFVVVLMLMAFTSQLMAAQATFCQMKRSHLGSNGMSNSMTMAGMNHSMADMEMNGPSEKMMDHSMHLSGKQKSTGDQKSNCCKTKGPCSLGNCALGNCSLIGMNNPLPFSVEILKSTATSFYASARPSRLISSLYRPPTFS